jgi:site-specific recombinase XerC
MAATPASSPDDGAGPSAPPASLSLIDAFVDSLWLEAGLAKLTLEAYRRDLRLLAEHLQASEARTLAEATEADLLGYIAARHAGSRATSANRRLTVFRRFSAGRCARGARPPTPPAPAGGAPAAARAATLSRRRWRRCWPHPTGTPRWACATAPCWS